MTNRERLLAIMEGRSPDRVPWIPRLLIWYRAQVMRGRLPERLRGMPLREVERTLGMGTPAREGRVFSSTQGGDVEVTTRREGMSVVTTYRTPAGTVQTRAQRSEEWEVAPGIFGHAPNQEVREGQTGDNEEEQISTRDEPASCPAPGVQGREVEEGHARQCADRRQCPSPGQGMLGVWAGAHAEDDESPQPHSEQEQREHPVACCPVIPVQHCRRQHDEKHKG